MSCTLLSSPMVETQPTQQQNLRHAQPGPRNAHHNKARTSVTESSQSAQACRSIIQTAPQQKIPSHVLKYMKRGAMATGSEKRMTASDVARKRYRPSIAYSTQSRVEMERLEAKVRNFDLSPQPQFSPLANGLEASAHPGSSCGTSKIQMPSEKDDLHASNRGSFARSVVWMKRGSRKRSFQGLHTKQPEPSSRWPHISAGNNSTEYVRVLFDYQPLNVTELNLHRGDVVRVLGTLDSGWYDGILRGVRGWFPSNYCTAIGRYKEFDKCLGELRSSPTSYDLAGPKPASSDCKSSEPQTSCKTSLERVELPKDSTEEPSSVAVKDRPEILDKDVCNDASLETSLGEQKSDKEFWSESELSFAGVRTNSGSCSPSEVLSPFTQSIALDLASRILRQYIRQQQKPEQQQQHHDDRKDSNDPHHGTNKAESTSAPSSSQSSPSQTSGWSKKWTVVSPCLDKRKLGKANEDSDDDEDNSDHGRKAHKKARDDNIKLFACPFAKFDPDRYSERNVNEREYRSCSSCLLRDIPRLKQHLYRVHKRPEHYCPSCFEAFKSRTLLDEHVRSRSCSLREPLYDEKMTVDQMKEIKRRNRGGTAYEHWYGIFKILFPAAVLPTSPYTGEDDASNSAIQHFVNFFRAFGPENFFDLIRDRQGIAPNLDATTQQIVDEAFEITAPALMRQVRSDALATADNVSPETQRPILTAVRSAADSISSRRSDQESSTDPTLQDQCPAEALDDLTKWSVIDQTGELATESNAMDVFDFDAAFDPLTVDDAFASYHNWCA